MAIVSTAAGRALLASAWMLAPGEPLMTDTILAIEAEAREQERERVRAAALALIRYFDSQAEAQRLLMPPDAAAAKLFEFAAASTRDYLAAILAEQPQGGEG